MSEPVHLAFDRGTVLVSAGPPGFEYTSLPGVLFDPRTSMHRAEARHYRAIVEKLITDKVPYSDGARGWPNQSTGWKLQVERTPHPHQTEALNTWWGTGRRGVVALPTGTGKTFVAVMCMEKVARPTLVVTPTLDLLRQWVGQLSEFFGVPVAFLSLEDMLRTKRAAGRPKDLGDLAWLTGEIAQRRRRRV